MDAWQSVQSWAIVLAAGGAAYAYYANQNKPQPARTRSGSTSEPTQLPAKPQKQRDSNSSRRKSVKPGQADPSGSDAVSSTTETTVPSSAGNAGKKRKAGSKKSEQAPPPAVSVAPQKDEVQDEQNNTAWAQQMANVQKGTNLAPPQSKDSRNRTVKASAMDASPAISSPSSTGGVDGDDDLSPAISPSLNAGDVSDMLEKPAAGPSILRLTEPSNPKPARQQRATQEFQQAETKKQRQNRKKIEERKVERELAEKERQALLEKTRKSAREARGEPARNGIPVSKPPAVSAWSAQGSAKTSTPTSAPSSNNNAPLLDTFDPDADSMSSSTGALNTSTAATSTVSNLDTEMPSEEEQLQLAKKMSEDDSGWNTVSVPKKKSKKAGSSEDGMSAPPTPMERPAAPKPAAKPAKSTNGFAYLDQIPNIDAGSHPDDSQWDA